tara:strand:+ start:120 stop:1169 length:1050 start_codon:yes stop_codon:yes gene_type:complete
VKILLSSIAIVGIVGIFLTISVSAQEEYNIPDWVKNTAGWWADDQIDDASFVNGIKFLIENDVMEIETQDATAYDEYPDNGDFYVTYEPNPNSLYTGEDTAIAWLKNTKLLEYEIEFLNENFRLEYDVEIIATECNEANAFYDSYSKQIILCYELVDDIQEKYTLFHYDVLELTDDDWNYDDYNSYAFDVVDFIFWHEMGHAFIDIYKLPVTGLEENVADQFASLMLLYTYDETTGSYSLGQSMVDNVGTWFYNSDYYVTEIYPLETGEEIIPEYWGFHALDMQRFYNVSCYAYGSNPHSPTVAYLVADGWLPEERAANCEWEYQQIEYSFAYLLEPFDYGFFDYYFEE